MPNSDSASLRQQIWVTGARGLLGSSLVKRGAIDMLADIGHSDWCNEVRESLEGAGGITPCAIINCAAKTDVDWCEQYPTESAWVNVTGVANLATTLRRWYGDKDAPLLVHISTDHIYDGRDGPYSEDDPPAPLSVYGAQKMLAEAIVRTYPRHLIVRTTCLLGWHERKRTFAHWVLDQLAKGEKFDVTAGQYTTPTYAPDLARIILELIDKGVTGTVNVTSGVWDSRYWWAREIAFAFGYNPEYVQPGGRVQQVAPRPKWGGLKVDKLRSLGITPQPFAESLKEMADTWPARR